MVSPEWQLPDSVATPYLALAGVIAAGLGGIERGLDPGERLNRNDRSRSPEYTINPI